MSFSTCSAGALSGPDFCFIFAACGYDEPEILPSLRPSVCLKGADGEQTRIYRRRLRRYRHQPSICAKRGSKLTAANVIEAIVIFRNMFILPWKSWLLRLRQFQQRDYSND